MSCCPICSCASHFVQSFFCDDSICVPSVHEHPHTYGMTPCSRSDVNNINIAFFIQIFNNKKRATRNKIISDFWQENSLKNKFLYTF